MNKEYKILLEAVEAMDGFKQVFCFIMATSYLPTFFKSKDIDITVAEPKDGDAPAYIEVESKKRKFANTCYYVSDNKEVRKAKPKGDCITTKQALNWLRRRLVAIG